MKYEYTAQWRMDKDDDWHTIRVTYPTKEGALRGATIAPKHAEVRIVRRPVNDWEVVK